jgi:8-oxo-dGTP pyrophosphatase MutT (NUDIX family)
VTTKICDNTSVGVIITNEANEFLMFERATFPPGLAPVAGHVDTHGTLRQAAETEVREEVGLTVVTLTETAANWPWCGRSRPHRPARHREPPQGPARVPTQLSSISTSQAVQQIPVQ